MTKKILLTHLFRSFFFLGLLISIISCSASDDSPEENGETLISAKIGGVDWEATTHKATLIVIQDQGQRFDLEAFDKAFKIKLGVSEFGPDDGTLTEKTYTDPNNTGLAFYYGMGNNTYILEHHSTPDFDSEPDIKIHITSSSSEAVSGTFTGTFYKVGDLTGMNTPEIVVITDGIFRNVPFEVHEYTEP